MKRVLLISSFLFVFFSAGAQVPAEQKDTVYFSLQEAIDYALENNRNVDNARRDVESSQGRVWETTATGLPRVSANVSYQNNLELMTTLIPAEFFGGEPGTYQPVQFGTQHNAVATLSASQLIFSGPYIVGLQAANTYRELAKKNLVKSETDLKSQVIGSYYSILMAEGNLEIIRKNFNLINTRYLETKAMYEAGFIEETDVDQLEISRTSLENDIRTAESSVEISYRLLKYAMDYPMDREIRITENLEDFMQEVTRGIINRNFNIEDHIEYKLMKTREQLAWLNMRRQQAEYLPSLSASYTYQEMAQRNEFNFFDSSEDWYPSSVLGFNLNIPIFASGMRRARVNQARVEWEKAKNNKEYLARGLELGVSRARLDFVRAYEQYESQKRNVQLSEKVFNKTSIKYQEGMASSLELTQVSNQLIQNQSALLMHKVELLNAKLSLDQALGYL